MMAAASGLKSRLEVCFERVEGHPRARWSTRPPLDLRGPLAGSGGAQLYFLRNHTCGILSGDDLEVDITADRDVDVQVGAPSSTKVYASDERSRLRLRIGAREGARVVWQPQPIILHAESDFEQSTRIVLLGGSVVYSEVIVLGRLARGESNRFRRFESALCVAGGDDDEPMYEEHYVLEPESMPALQASVAGMGAIASVFLLGARFTNVELDLSADTSCYAGAGTLPNGAGVVVRALGPSLSAAVQFVESVLHSKEYQEAMK